MIMNERSRSKRVKNVLSLQVARERARQAKGASDRQIPKRSNPRLLERLEAENAQLRGSVVELVLQVQALRDRARIFDCVARHSGRKRPLPSRLSQARGEFCVSISLGLDVSPAPTRCDRLRAARTTHHRVETTLAWFKLDVGALYDSGNPSIVSFANSIASFFEYLAEGVRRLLDSVPVMFWPSKRLK